MSSRGIVPYLVVTIGVLIVATSSILIRYAQNLGLSSMGIAAGRLGLAALILLPIALVRARSELRALTPRQIRLGMVSGVFLALHFASWISSLEYTSVASSVALVSTNPLWVALASIFIFRERISMLAAIGVGLTILGSALIGFSDSGGAEASNVLFGDLLAIMGAVTVSMYFLIGRRLRRELNTLTYVWLVYTSAALVLLVLLASGMFNRGLGLGEFAGIPAFGWLLLLGLALGPQLIGHTTFNWGLRYLSATFVAVAILGEPIASAILALVLFHETFQPLQLVGFAVLLSGIAVAARAERSPASTQGNLAAAATASEV